MPASSAALPDEPDRQQIDTLCDDLGARVDTIHQEQVLLGQLVAVTASTRPARSRHYRTMLDHVRTRYDALQDLLARYCR